MVFATKQARKCTDPPPVVAQPPSDRWCPAHRPRSCSSWSRAVHKQITDVHTHTQSLTFVLFIFITHCSQTNHRYIYTHTQLNLCLVHLGHALFTNKSQLYTHTQSLTFVLFIFITHYSQTNHRYIYTHRLTFVLFILVTRCSQTNHRQLSLCLVYLHHTLFTSK